MNSIKLKITPFFILLISCSILSSCGGPSKSLFKYEIPIFYNSLENRFAPCMLSQKQQKALKQSIKYNDTEGLKQLLVGVPKADLKHLLFILFNDRETAKNLTSEAIELLIHFGADVSALDYDGKTPIFYAIRKIENPDIVKTLMQQGAKLNVADREGVTPLCVAAEHNDPEMVEFLINLGQDVNHKDHQGNTPLIHTTKLNNFPDVIKALLGHGAKVDAVNKNGYSALHYAIMWGAMDSVKVLLEHGAPIEDERFTATPLHWAAGAIPYNQHTKESRNNKEGRLEVAEFLIEKGANINAKIKQTGYTPLHVAAMMGSPKTASLLLRNGADPNARDNQGATPLLRLNPDASSIISGIFGSGASHSIDIGPVIKTFHILLAHGADINAADEKGRMLIHRVMEEYPEALDFLIENGANLPVSARS